VELEHLKEKDHDTFTLSNIDDVFDLYKLDKVLRDLTCNVLACSLLAKHKKTCIIPNALPMVQMRGITNDPIDLHGVQDSLSLLGENFVIQSKKDLQLQEKNNIL